MGMITKKVCMVGDFGVGKTSLIRRFVERQFSDRYLSTVGVKISRKTLTLPESTVTLKLVIWDLEGRTKFKEISATYLQGSHGILIVADATRPETITGVMQHIQDFTLVNPEGAIAIALNKSDLVDGESHDKLQALLPEKNKKIITTQWTSAKTDMNVDLLFETLAHYL